MYLVEHSIEVHSKIFGGKMMKKFMLVFALVGAMSMALVQTVGASVPFKGTGNGAVTGMAPGPLPGEVLLTAAATGHATHLGEYTRVENIDLYQGQFTGDVTFTAANGDQLTADFTGAFTSGSTAEGTYTFTGGTGRFTNATGTTSFAIALSDPAHFTVDFNGSINY